MTQNQTQRRPKRKAQKKDSECPSEPAEDDELQKIIQEQAERNPQLKDQVLKFYKNPENFEKIKGPILEEKAFDHILTIVKVKDS